VAVRHVLREGVGLVHLFVRLVLELVRLGPVLRPDLAERVEVDLQGVLVEGRAFLQKQ
jgi:hypothetical protein